MLADVHHVKLIQDGMEKGTLVFMASDGFTKDAAIEGDDWDVTLDFGETTTIVAKAATQTAMPIIGVDFSWASKNEDAVTVDDGMIEAVGSGTSEITVTAAGRGIAVKFDVMVLSEVKSVAMTAPVAEGGTFYLANGESVDLDANAYPKARDDDGNIVDEPGDPVDVAITYMSSDNSVVEIDKSSAKAVGVGSAKITAHYAGVASKAITINVTPGGDTTHKITYTRINADDRKFHIVWNADSTAVSVYGPGEVGDDNDSAGAGNTNTNAVYTVQVRIFDSEGNANIDANASTAGDLTVKLQPATGVLDATGIIVALNAGNGTVTVTNGGGSLGTKELNTGASDAIAGPGTARIILSYPGADDIVLPAVMVTETTEEADDAG